MVKIKTYISGNFVKGFLTIFIPFFLIISLVYLVKIAALTSKIQITFAELLTLFSYSVPDIVFYTLPLSFIAALANVLVKLSQDNELIALYALGFKSEKIVRGLLLIALLFSLLLASISFFAMPLSKQLYKSFKSDKKSEAKLNIVAGELGQKFGEYYIYVKDKEGDILNNLVIYNRSEQNSEQFFASKTGSLNQYENHVTSLKLNNGYGYTYRTHELQQARYKSLEMFDGVQKSPYHFIDIVTHWSRASTEPKMMHRVLFFAFVSLIPLLSVYLVASFTMINPRYQENRAFLTMFTISLTLYMIASALEKWGSPTTLLLSIFFTLLLGYILFQKRVTRYF
ncbi:MAG: LptF/LptG family permease [Sulfurovum sp.]|nr:LptF/LptG family permease [Sulfurovum sp.]